MEAHRLRVASRLLVAAAGLAGTACSGPEPDGISALSAPLIERAGEPTPPQRFTAFESGQVRPLALSPTETSCSPSTRPTTGSRSSASTASGCTPVASVPVGLEPVAVAARSDAARSGSSTTSPTASASSTCTGAGAARVVRTLLVGDEPRDIVFAGPRTVAGLHHHRAPRPEHAADDPAAHHARRRPRRRLGVRRATAWAARSAARRSRSSRCSADTPRALAVSPDGAHGLRGGVPLRQPHHRHHRAARSRPTAACRRALDQRRSGQPTPPATGVIVKYRIDRRDGSALGRRARTAVWDDAGAASRLPDKDVFAIDANADPPAPVSRAAGSYAGVGTVLFNMAVNPVSGKVYVSNTEARNDVRFEGHNAAPSRGQHRCAATSPRAASPCSTGAAAVAPRHLNKHIDYAPAARHARRENGQAAWPSRIGMAVIERRPHAVRRGARLEQGRRLRHRARSRTTPSCPTPPTRSRSAAAGPTGLVLDEAQRPPLRAHPLRQRDLGRRHRRRARRSAHVRHVQPRAGQRGRTGGRFLYDAALTSSHGDSACASCHIFGDFDSLAWDLGDPDDRRRCPTPAPFDPALLRAVIGAGPTFTTR